MRSLVESVLVPALLLQACVLVAGPIADPHAARFGGETCVTCHSSQAAPRPSVPEASFDVVIVGGGMAGLSALHYLEDRNSVLLEAENEPGGQMREDTWKGLHFAKGAAYFVEPYGVLREFYEGEKIPLVKIPPPENSAWIGGKHYPNCWTKEGREHMPWNGKPLASWVAWLQEMEDVNNTNRSNQPFDSFDPNQRVLDRMDARTYLKGKGLIDPMISHLDLYIPSCFGVPSPSISASAFVNYLSGEIGGNYTLPGGLGAVIKIIYNNHRDRVRLGCRVTSVTQSLFDSRVTYLGPDGKGHTLRAKTVIMAVPCNLLPGLVPDLPEEKRKVIARTRYASYMVAGVLCKEVLWDDKGYDTWIEGTFFRDIIDATWIQRDGTPHKNRKQPHVLSLYIPLGEGALPMEMSRTPESFDDEILKDLEKVIPGSRSKVEGIRLYRFGHSMHVATPGFMSESVPVLRKPYFRIYFAGAEVEGLPCNESAILSGYAAARGVQTWLWDKTPRMSKDRGE